VGRLEKINNLLAEKGADAVLLTGAVNRRYILGGQIAEGMAIINRHGCRFFTDSRYLEAAQNEIPNAEISCVTRDRPYEALLKDTVWDWHISVLGFEEENLSAGKLLRYEQKLNVKLLGVQRELDSFRMVKEPWELKCIVDAQAVTDAAFTRILDEIRPGISERQLRRRLISILYDCGADDLSFDPIVVSGPNTSLPHGVAGDRLLQKGDFITLDFGCISGGYCSDMTRTVALGSASEEMRHVYETVLEAQLAGISATRAGVTGAQVDAAAREIIKSHGFGAYFGHGYGHGVGLEIHEGPNCSPSWPHPLPEHAVCSAEPGIYLPGKFGVRIEDLVVVEKDGCTNLTHSGKSLIII